MQEDLGEHDGQTWLHLPGHPIGSIQQGPAVGAAAVSEEADGLWSEAVAAAEAAAAAAVFSPAFNAGGRAHKMTAAGGSDSGPTGALDLLASLANLNVGGHC